MGLGKTLLTYMFGNILKDLSHLIDKLSSTKLGHG